jgi:hypothetical protein
VAAGGAGHRVESRPERPGAVQVLVSRPRQAGATDTTGPALAGQGADRHALAGPPRPPPPARGPAAPPAAGSGRRARRARRLVVDQVQHGNSLTNLDGHQAGRGDRLSCSGRQMTRRRRCAGRGAGGDGPDGPGDLQGGAGPPDLELAAVVARSTGVGRPLPRPGARRARGAAGRRAPSPTCSPPRPRSVVDFSRPEATAAAGRGAPARRRPPGLGHHRPAGRAA